MIGTLNTSKNMWRNKGRLNFPIDSLALYLPLWESSQASLLNGTGIATEAPLALVGPAAQTFNATQAGTFLIYLPKGATGTATSGTATITSSPVSLVGGLNTITAEGTGDFTVAVPTIISKDLNAHVCTVTGTTWTSQGRDFNNAADVIKIPNHAALQIVDTLTLTVVFKLDALADYYCLINKMIADGTRYEYALYTNAAGEMIFQFTDAGGTVRAVTTTLMGLATTTWYRVAVTFSDAANQVIFYKNGSLVQTLAQTNTPAATIGQVCIGKQANGSWPTNGIIGEAYINNKILAAGEIQQNYLATKWRFSG